MTETRAPQMVCPNPEMFPLIWSHFRAHDIPTKDISYIPLRGRTDSLCLAMIDQLFDSSDKRLARTLPLLARYRSMSHPSGWVV